MTTYKVFIPQLSKQVQTSTDFKPWVTNYVSTEMNKISNVFIKTDGSNQPLNDIDFNQNTISNIRESVDESDPVKKK